jgi:hypothetical protein
VQCFLSCVYEFGQLKQPFDEELSADYADYTDLERDEPSLFVAKMFSYVLRNLRNLRIDLSRRPDYLHEVYYCLAAGTMFL